MYYGYSDDESLLSESNTLRSLIVIKNDLVHLKKLMGYSSLSYRDKKSMIQELKNDDKWTADCLHSRYKIPKEAKKEFVDWFYMLTYCNLGCRLQIEEILTKRDVSLSTFCAFVARICFSINIDLTIFFFRFSTRPLTFSEKIEGLSLCGLAEKQFIDCLSVLNDINEIKDFNLMTITTPPNSAAKSSSAIQEFQDSSQKKKKNVLPQKKKKKNIVTKEKKKVLQQKNKKSTTTKEKKKVSQTPKSLLHNLNQSDSLLSKEIEKKIKYLSKQLEKNETIINNKYSFIFK